MGKSGKAKTPTMKASVEKSASRNSKRNLRTTKTHKDEPTMNLQGSSDMMIDLNLPNLQDNIQGLKIEVLKSDFQSQITHQNGHIESNSTLVNELNEIVANVSKKQPEAESTIGSDETGRDDFVTKPTTTKVNSRLVGPVSGGARDFIDEIDFLDHG